MAVILLAAALVTVQTVAAESTPDAKRSITPSSEPDTTPGRKPNIILIVLDDLDYADVGAYGSEDIRTDTLDELAREGMRFDQYYVNAPVCSPARAAMLTGRYPARLGIKRALPEDSVRGIPAEWTTLPEVLGNAGYRTAHIGKWHLGGARPDALPQAQGFDHVVRFVETEGPRYRDFELSTDGGEILRYGEGQHLTEVLTDHALEFLDETVRDHPGQPFFLNLWYLAPHTPVNELPHDFDDSETGYCRDGDLAADDCGSLRRNYAVLVTNVDRQIRRIIDWLDRASGGPDLSAHTLVIVASDNGGDRQWHGHRDAPFRKLRDYKGRLYEGGIRVPMIARWPGAVPAGAVSDALITSFDLLPTFAEIGTASVAGIPLDGMSFAEVLRDGQAAMPARLLFWENKNRTGAFSSESGILNTFAVRRGDFKLVFTPDEGKLPALRSLFDLAQDPYERRNLLEPAGRQRRTELFGYEIRVNELPEDSGDFEPYRHELLANELEAGYYDWRTEIGDIACQTDERVQRALQADEWLGMAQGAVELDCDQRVDFDDADFSFLVTLDQAAIADGGTIAEKAGSWRFALVEGRLRLEVWGPPAPGSEAPVIIESAPLANAGPARVGFTVFGWRDSPSTIRLFAEGRMVAASDATTGVMRVAPGSGEEANRIHLGSGPDGGDRLRGRLRSPRLSVLSLYPSEVFSDYASRRMTRAGGSPE